MKFANTKHGVLAAQYGAAAERSTYVNAGVAYFLCLNEEVSAGVQYCHTIASLDLNPNLTGCNPNVTFCSWYQRLYEIVRL